MYSENLSYKWSNTYAYSCYVLLLINNRLYVFTRDETILQYIDILQYFLQQYNTIRLKGNINILHTAIYCDILQYIAVFVVLML